MGGSVGHTLLLATAHGKPRGRSISVPTAVRLRRSSLSISSAQQTILVQAYLLYSTRLAGALVRAHQRGVQVHVILDANAQTHDPPVKAVALLVGAGDRVSPLMITMNGHTTKS